MYYIMMTGHVDQSATLSTAGAVAQLEYKLGHILCANLNYWKMEVSSSVQIGYRNLYLKFTGAIFYYHPLKKNLSIHFLEKVGEAMVSKFLSAEAANVFCSIDELESFNTGQGMQAVWKRGSKNLAIPEKKTEKKKREQIGHRSTGY